MLCYIHMNVVLHTYECCVTYIWMLYYIQMIGMIRKNLVLHVNVVLHTHKCWVGRREWGSNTSCHTSHGTYNTSHVMYQWVMSRINESRYIWTNQSHITRETRVKHQTRWVMSHMWLKTCHTYICETRVKHVTNIVVSFTNMCVTCLNHMCDMTQIYVCHATHIFVKHV